MKNEGLSKIDYALSLLMPAILMVMSITHSAIYLYIVLGLALLRITKPIVILPVYFVASLSTEWFGLGTGVSSGRLLSVMLIVSLFIDVLVNKKRRKADNSTLLIIVFSLYCLFSSIFSVTGKMGAFFLILQGLLVLLLFTIRKNDDVSQLANVFFYTAIIVLIGVFVTIATIGLAQFMYARMGAMEEIETNSNRIAMMMAQIGAIFGFTFFREGFSVKGTLSIVLYLATLFVIFLTGSRTGLIAVLFSLFIMFLVMQRAKARSIVIFGFVLGITLYFAFGYMEEQNFAVMERFSLQNVVESGGSDRANAISVMWNEVFPEYPIFGVGLGGENFNEIAKNYGMDHPCHNIFFDSLCQLGIAGFILFFCVVFYFYRATYRCITKDDNDLAILGFFLILTATLNGIGETVYLEKLFWNAVVICVIDNSYIRINTKTQNNGTN